MFQRAPGTDDVLEPLVLVEALREVADDVPVLRGDEDDVELLVVAVARHAGHQVAGRGGLDRENRRVPGLLGSRREVPAVIGRALLVPEGLEAVLQVLLELLVELLRRDLEGLLVGIVPAADDALPQGEQELPDALLAPLRFHELEGCVAEVVDHAGVGELAVVLHLADLRDPFGDGNVSDGHQIEGPPHAGQVVRQPFVHPERHVAADQRPRNDVELEDVRELVGDQPIQLIGRFVDWQHQPRSLRFGERRHAFGHVALHHVLLLELALRLEDDHRHLERQVVLEVRADLLIGAFRVARDPLEVLLEFRVVVDLEVLGRVDAPLEIVVLDAVLAEIGDEPRLRTDLPGCEQGQQGRRSHGGRTPGPRAHKLTSEPEGTQSHGEVHESAAMLLCGRRGPQRSGPL